MTASFPRAAAAVMVTAAAVAACSASPGTQHTYHHAAPAVKVTTQAAAPMIPDTRSNRALCGMVRILLQVHGQTPVAATQAGLVLLNAALQQGTASPALRSVVSAWALSLSTDLSAGQTSGPGTPAAQAKVAAKCAEISVSI